MVKSKIFRKSPQILANNWQKNQTTVKGLKINYFNLNNPLTKHDDRR